ncbi:MAG: tRNA 2-thiouridine(34) synthase MnmA [Acidobacteria bacterium]|nr:tRNA 2-thiouridine(34) synthase MnmA [Acidobacteriota bacterium]
MSGGLDSSVAAALLVKDGHDVVGVSLQLSDESRGGAVSRCCSSADLRDARLVAAALDIPYYVVNDEAAFDREVRAPFLDAYAAGRTPNPCVRCNSALKFGTLLRIARAIGADRIATGHYARVEADPATGAPRLLRGVDRAKDQSYFLFDLDASQLGAALFPLGGMTKAAVREAAVAMDLPVAGKAESQDLCFVPGGDTRAYLREALGSGAAGDVVDASGAVLGNHRGVHEFTVGQRRGLGIAASRPLYVLAVDGASNRVVVGGESELDAATLTASGCRLHDATHWAGPFRAEARIRSRHEGAPADVTPLGDGRMRVAFEKPQRAVTPGQAIVLYDGDRVLGGGWIDSRDLDSDRGRPVACAELHPERA